MNPFLTVYGHISLDQIVSVDEFPRMNTSVDVTNKQTSLGGTAANVAVTAARLGVPTAICAFVGKDFPKKYEDLMASSGLIMDEVVKVDGYDTSTAIVINDHDLNQKVLFFEVCSFLYRRAGISHTYHEGIEAERMRDSDRSRTGDPQDME